MHELILPTTDGGVAVQAVLVIVLGAGSAALLRKKPESRLLAIGASLLALALMGIRALH